VAALSPSSESSRGRERFVSGIAGTLRSSTYVALLLCFDSLAALALSQPDRPREHTSPSAGRGHSPSGWCTALRIPMVESLTRLNSCGCNCPVLLWKQVAQQRYWPKTEILCCV
jgi:hypothetical protein